MAADSACTGLRVAVCAAFLGVFISVYGHPSAAGPEPPSNLDKISSLPGIDIEKLGFDLYAGQVELQNPSNTQLFYWFAQSQNDPDNDPILLWMNGGPGCSSLYSMFEENGPFTIHKEESKEGLDLVLDLNPYSWNRNASVIFLEAPYGVGFSVDPTNSTRYQSSDITTAVANHLFLQRWYARFPQFTSNRLYLGGEGYAGHFVPQLAEQIFHWNAGGQSPLINLAGFIIGNPLTDKTIDSEAFYPYMFGHSFASLETANLMREHCNGNFVNPSPECRAAMELTDDEMGAFNPLNLYGACEDKTAGGSKQPTKCINTELLPEYLNMASVQRSIHATTSSSSLKWAVCSSQLEYDQNVASVVSVYPKLLEHYRALIYSGDLDTVVPATGTQMWIENLTLGLVEPWRAWHQGDQVAGYRVEYANLTYATVKGAGHLAPQLKPMESLTEAAEKVKHRDWGEYEKVASNAVMLRILMKVSLAAAFGECGECLSSDSIREQLFL